MADINEEQQSELIRITNSDEDKIAKINNLDELKVDDTPESATSLIKTVTTTAVVANVSGSNRVNRKIIELQPITGKINWGYDSSCPFELSKKAIRIISASDTLDVYYKAVSGSVDVAVGEK